MMGDSTKKSFADLLGTAKLPERAIDICMRGDLNAELRRFDEELTKAQKRSLESLAGGGDIGALLERIEALQAEMAENTYTFRLRSLSKPKFRAILAEHPPRRIKAEDSDEMVVHPADQYTGINGETFHDALIRACLVDPADLDDEGWAQLVDVLNDFQYDELASAAWGLNRSDVDPFSKAASRMTQASEPE